MSSYSGYVLASQVAESFNSHRFELLQPLVSGGPRLCFADTGYGIARWGEYKLFSPTPLSDEIEGGIHGFEYQVFIVRGRGKIVILAAKRRIVDYAMSYVLDRLISPNLRKVSIYIDRLIKFCTTPESEFLITSLHGRFAGASRNLKSLSMYGDDVTNSTVYSDNSKLFNFHSCGVGRRLYDGLPKLKPNDEGEIARVSHDGFINLNLNSRRQALELMRVIEFIFVNRWVEDWVPRVGEVE